MQRLTGWTPEELAGREMSVLSPPHVRDEYRTGLASYLNPEERPQHAPAAEAVVQHRDGREVPIEITFTTFHEGGVPAVRRLHARCLGAQGGGGGTAL